MLILILLLEQLDQIGLQVGVEQVIEQRTVGRWAIEGRH